MNIETLAHIYIYIYIYIVYLRLHPLDDLKHICKRNTLVKLWLQFFLLGFLPEEPFEFHIRKELRTTKKIAMSKQNDRHERFISKRRFHRFPFRYCTDAPKTSENHPMKHHSQNIHWGCSDTSCKVPWASHDIYLSIYLSIRAS